MITGDIVDAVNAINSGCNQVRNCRFGLHADQTAEMVCIQAAFYFKGLLSSSGCFAIALPRRQTRGSWITAR